MANSYILRFLPLCFCRYLCIILFYVVVSIIIIIEPGKFAVTNHILNWCALSVTDTNGLTTCSANFFLWKSLCSFYEKCLLNVVCECWTFKSASICNKKRVNRKVVNCLFVWNKTKIGFCVYKIIYYYYYHYKPVKFNSFLFLDLYKKRHTQFVLFVVFKIVSLLLIIFLQRLSTDFVISLLSIYLFQM